MRKIARLGLVASLLLAPMLSFAANATTTKTQTAAHEKRNVTVALVQPDRDGLFVVNQNYWDNAKPVLYTDLSSREIAALSDMASVVVDSQVKPNEILPFSLEQKSGFLASSETLKNGNVALHPGVNVSLLKGNMSLGPDGHVGISFSKEKTDFIFDGLMAVSDSDTVKSGYSLSGLDSDHNTAVIVGHDHSGAKEMLIVVEH